MTYDITSPKITATLDSIEVPGEEDLADAFDVTLSMNDLVASYTMGTGAKPTLDMKLTSAGADMVVAGREPGGPGAFDANFAFKSIGWNANTIFAQGDKPGDLTSMLRAGMMSDSALTHGGANYSMSFQDRGDSFAMSGSSDSGSAAISMGDGTLGYLVSNTNMSVSVSGSEIPLPEIALTAAASAFGITTPVIASDDQKDLGMTLRLEGFSVSDMIWGMIDPSGQLPRDPANLIIELAGKATLLLDIMDPVAMAEYRGDMPGGLHAMDVKELEVSLAGASLTGMGGFTFDMNDLETFDGLPAPTGALDLKLVGGNGLMDKLVDMGLLPQEQAMGARMMMGLFARPGDGEDTLVSKIEVDGPSGAISANGQRLQ